MDKAFGFYQALRLAHIMPVRLATCCEKSQREVPS